MVAMPIMMSLGESGLSSPAYLSIIAQHASSNLSEQSLDFAAYLFFITLFPRTLIPASMLGLGMTLAGVFLSSWVGKMVDREPRLGFARRAIGVQKIAQMAVYIGFLALFSVVSMEDALPAKPSASARGLPTRMLQHFRSQQMDIEISEVSSGINAFSGLLLAWIVLCATVGRLATTGITLAVDRDWIVIISESHPHILTKLNTSLRRTFLLTRLLAPLFVSLLTTLVSYRTCVLILMGNSLVSLGGEEWMVGVVWRRCEALGKAEEGRGKARTEGVELGVRRVSGSSGTGYEAVPEEEDEDGSTQNRPGPPVHRAWWASARETIADFAEFSRLPVFMSSLSMASLYLTTLSFDGILLSWLKSTQGYSDGFIACMRGLCVLTGLAGTFVMPLGETYLGLVRTGAWFIWSEAGCLFAVLFALSTTISSTGPPNRLTSLSSALFFTAIALSRIGLYAFDLVQVQEIQIALKDHPKSGRFQAAQMGMQSGMEVLKFGIVLVLHRPEQFPWTAMISTAAVVTGGLLYSRYVYQVRGHLLHWNKLWGNARSA